VSDARPVHEFTAASPVRRVTRVAVTSRPVAALSARVLPGIDRLVFRLTGGRVTFSAWVTGLPVVRVTTTGARSGEPRPVRMLGVPDGDGLIVIAANFGSAANPAWVHNLRARPDVTVALEGSSHAYRARELTGSERERGFDRALSLNPGWRRFQSSAGSRVIPVFRLQPV
jgi:deazaflavin-dependent oxidoreductase (nitroreductase family)